MNDIRNIIEYEIRGKVCYSNWFVIKFIVIVEVTIFFFNYVWLACNYKLGRVNYEIDGKNFS